MGGEGKEVRESLGTRTYLPGALVWFHIMHKSHSTFLYRVKMLQIDIEEQIIQAHR
jgi:hypothetical protein